MSRAERRDREAKIEERFRRVTRDSWGWREANLHSNRVAQDEDGEYRLRRKTPKEVSEEKANRLRIIRKLAHNPAACSKCCGHRRETEGPTIQEKRAIPDAD